MRTRPKSPAAPAGLALSLSATQQQVVEGLLRGQSDQAIATALGLPADIVAQWRHTHPGVIAALNQRRQTQWTEAQARLRALVPQAIDVLAAAVAQGDRKAAVEVLKIVRLSGTGPPPPGPTDPELVLWEQAAAQAAQDGQRAGPALTLEALVEGPARRQYEQTHARMAALRRQWTGAPSSDP
jgi:hypothetical protein